MMKNYRLVKVTEPFFYNGEQDDFLLFMVSIPFIGTIIVLFYFLFRKKEEYLEEVKGV